MGIYDTLLRQPLNRAAIEAAVSKLIEVLDMLDGDPDDEETDVEDSFALSHLALGQADGPGCPISDPGGRTPDEDCVSNALGYAAGEGPGCPLSDSDCAIDDGPCDGDNEDREPQEEAMPSYGLDQTTGMKPWQPANDVRARKPHLERIRATRCERSSRGYWGITGREYRLLDEPVTIAIVPQRRRRKLTERIETPAGAPLT